MLGKIPDAFVLQSYAVQHTACRLSHTWVVISLSRLVGCTLHDDAAYASQFHYILELCAVTECSACRHHGVAEFQPSYISP